MHIGFIIPLLEHHINSKKFKEMQRKSCVVIQLCLSIHIRSLRDVRIDPRNNTR